MPVWILITEVSGFQEKGAQEVPGFYVNRSEYRSLGSQKEIYAKEVRNNIYKNQDDWEEPKRKGDC